MKTKAEAVMNGKAQENTVIHFLTGKQSWGYQGAWNAGLL